MPKDFDADVYLRLHPDVAAAGVDPEKHYLRHGHAEGRPYRSEEGQKAAVSEFFMEKPSPQAIADLFAGEWSSAFPASSNVVVKPGHAALFDDPRITALERNLGPVAGKKVLELGPLEAAHTYMLHELGAAQITAIEANKRAFLKCLAVKEIFGLQRARFLLGDSVEYLESTDQKFDIILASGILYHMTDPVRMLEALTSHADRVFVWTHYYDEAVIRTRNDKAFFDTPKALDADGALIGAKRGYPEMALSWSGFSGGNQPHAVWLTRDSILNFFAGKGFSTVTVEFDHPSHPNGPAFAFSASR